MAAVGRFAQVPMGQAVTSAVVDRVADGLMLGVFMLLVIAIHGANMLGRGVLVSVIGVFVVAAAGLVSFVIWGDRWQARVTRWAESWPAPPVRQRVPRWYAQALEGVQTLRQPRRLLTVGVLNVTVFLLDYGAMWLVIAAFGWSLPFWAAITVGVFIAVGTSLPSAPGYVGVYQVACVLALRIYGISEAPAAAYSIVLQVLTWTIVCVQGMWVAVSYGVSRPLGANSQLPVASSAVKAVKSHE